jgi:hypothetical protein
MASLEQDVPGIPVLGHQAVVIEAEHRGAARVVSAPSPRIDAHLEIDARAPWTIGSETQTRGSASSPKARVT